MSRTALLFRVGGDLHRVEGRRAILGRSRECDVRCDRQGVSRRHCEVIIDDEGVLVKDLESRHGTWIRGRPVTGGKRIRIGSKLSLGKVGPKLELAGALLEGRKLRPDGRGFLDSPSESMSASQPMAATPDRTAEVRRNPPAASGGGAGGPILPPHPSQAAAHAAELADAAASAAAPDSQLLRFAVYGFVVGVALGLAALVTFDVRPLLERLTG